MSTLFRTAGAGPGLTVSVLRELSELSRLRVEWEQLLGRSDGLHPSLTPTWLITWWRVFGPLDGRRLRTLVVRAGRELVGIVPLLERRRWHHGVVPMRRLELLASGEDASDEVVSEYLGPIAARGREAEVAEALADHLAERRASWHELVLSALDGASPAVESLEPALRARGFDCTTSAFGQCPYVALPRRSEDYLALLPSDHRYMARRSLRDFERWAGAQGSTVVVARTFDDLRQGKEILHSLHERRWQTAGRSGVFTSALFRTFHNMLMPALLERGELDLRWLVAHGRPVAVSYSILRNNRLFFYQGGREMDVPKGVRPGIVLHLHAIRAAIETGRVEYDFLGGDARYKRELSTATRTLRGLRVTRASLPEVARQGLAAGRGLLVEARNRARAVDD